MMNMPLLELDRVSVKKTNCTLLDTISLRISRNEFAAIIGPNGAGKTTLLNVIAGFERFDGELRLFGHAETWNRSRLTRMHIGYVPQSFEIDAAFPISAIEAVMTGVCGRIGLFRSPGKSDRKRAMELMEMMRVAHLASRPLGHLSGGERQKISLARAIIQQPEILLLDEPTSNLDIAVQMEVLRLIEDIYEQESMAVLFVTHDFNLLPKCMRRAICMNHGTVVFDGEIERALTSLMLSRLFGYPLETFEQNGRRFVSFG
jgi:ABC-type Mn2+/Zn2+ transport system ATPase subunit